MKIEKLSESQIRCTLSSFDLSIRQLDVNELTYGSQSAYDLFQEMVQQAALEHEFYADDLPIMVEAVPVADDGIILLITKLEDPEELDTRFSKFTSSIEDTAFDSFEYFNFVKDTKEGVDDILDSFQSISEEATMEIEKEDNHFIKKALEAGEVAEENQKNNEQANIIRIFSFPDLSTITRGAEVLKDSYLGSNTLYKDESTGTYYLIANKIPHSPIEFNRICNILSEYGKKEKNVYATKAYFDEHFTIIVKDQALQILAGL